MKKQEFIFIIIARILMFPFFIVMMFIYIMLLYLRLVLNYIRFGGESIVYTKNNSIKKVGDIYILLEDFLNESKT